MDQDSLTADSQCLTGPQHESGPGPSGSVHGQDQLGVGFGTPGRIDTVLLRVSRHSDATFGQGPGGIPGPAGPRGQVGGRKQADRSQQFDLGLVQGFLARFLRSGRQFHRHQGQYLNHVVLHDVSHRAGPVVEVGPALQTQRLLPEDVDLPDVGAVPDRRQHCLLDSEVEQVLDLRHAERVIDPEHRLLLTGVEHARQQRVQGHRAGQVLSEGLLHGDPAARRKAGLAQRTNGLGKHPGREGKVDRHRLPPGAPTTATLTANAQYGQGTGSVEATRGTGHVYLDNVELVGEKDIFGTTWNATAWAAATKAGTSWNGGSYEGSAWTGTGFASTGDWTGRSWVGNSWTGRSWVSETWSGRSWVDSSWTSKTWMGGPWASSTWS
jgi:hypothetical protein